MRKRTFSQKSKEKSTYKINRFPICAIVHYAIAKRLGYSENQAKAIGQACAIFYACCKFGYFRNRKKSNAKNEPKSKNNLNMTKLQFCDRVFNAIKIDGVLYPVMGDKVITEKDFDKTLLPTVLNFKNFS